VLAKTDANGALAVQARYRAYGEERGHWTAGGGAIPPQPADRHEWTGYEREHDAALDYAGARWYDPAIGQFLSHDPQRQYASPYAYGPGDPINGSDPSGEFWSFLAYFLGSLAVSAAAAALDSTGHANVSVGTASIGFTFGGAVRAASAQSEAADRPAIAGGGQGAEGRNGAAAKRNTQTTEPIERDDPGAVRKAKGDEGAAVGVRGSGGLKANEGEIRAGDVIEGLRQYRDPVDLSKSWDDTRFGHWWTESQPEGEAWGCYPKDPVSSPWQVLLGVAGELNQGYAADPHLGTGDSPGVQVYFVVATRNFSSRSEVLESIRSYANAYSGHWRWPLGPNCHTFQRDLYSTVGIEAVPVNE
jgi:RHS repeat-associated protein